MCGRYQLQLDAEGVERAVKDARWRQGHSKQHNARNSIRPTNYAPVVVHTRDTAQPEVVMMRWGLIPSWSAPTSGNSTGSALINARRETILELPSFSSALRRYGNSRRCVVPCTGFYEWHTSRAGKTPYLVRPRKGELKQMLLAGVYDVRSDLLESFAVITTEASDEFSWLHSRQPCVLESERDVDMWLNGARIPAEQAVKCVLRTMETGLVWSRVSADLNTILGKFSAKSDVPDVKKFFANMGGADWKGGKREKDVAKSADKEGMAALVGSSTAVKSEPFIASNMKQGGADPTNSQSNTAGAPKRSDVISPVRDTQSTPNSQWRSGTISARREAKRLKVETPIRKTSSKASAKSPQKATTSPKKGGSQGKITSFFKKT